MAKCDSIFVHFPKTLARTNALQQAYFTLTTLLHQLPYLVHQTARHIYMSASKSGSTDILALQNVAESINLRDKICKKILMIREYIRNRYIGQQGRALAKERGEVVASPTQSRAAKLT